MLRSWYNAFDSASSLCEMLICVMLCYLCVMLCYICLLENVRERRERSVLRTLVRNIYLCIQDIGKQYLGYRADLYLYPCLWY